MTLDTSRDSTLFDGLEPYVIDHEPYLEVYAEVLGRVLNQYIKRHRIVTDSIGIISVLAVDRSPKILQMPREPLAVTKKWIQEQEEFDRRFGPDGKLVGIRRFIPEGLKMTFQNIDYCFWTDSDGRKVPDIIVGYCTEAVHNQYGIQPGVRTALMTRSIPLTQNY